MNAYVVAQTEVLERESYPPHANGFEDIFSKHGGRFLVSSQSETVVAEGK